jgi:hypothetical protein
MNERDIKIDLLRVCKVAGSDSDINAVAFHALCDNLKQLGAADEREACAVLAQQTICDTHIPTGINIYGTRAAKAIRARGNT